MTAPSGRSAARVVNVALALAVTVPTLVAILLGAEMVVRYRERHRSTLGGTLPLLYYRHARLGHALVHDFDYFGWIHIDREGFRGPEVAVAPTPGTLRIMVVGSSTTFDPSVSGDAAAWPARLQFWLKALVPQRSVEVINAGVPGYRVIDDLIRLETDLYRFRPDIVILYEGHNDLFAALRRGREAPPPFTVTPGEVAPVTPWAYWLGRHSLLYAKVVARWDALRYTAAGRQTLARPEAAERSEGAAIDSGAAQLQRDLAAFLSVALSLRIRVVIPELVQVSGLGGASLDSATRRVWAQTVPFAKPETVLQGYARYAELMRTTAQQFRVAWVPTAQFGLVGPTWYEPDDPIHFNDRGADRMARQLAQALVAEHRLDAPNSMPAHF
jgi:lysophospholipase L1-like esterase